MSRPAPRRRPARVRLGLEQLEAREVPTVNAFRLASGEVQVSTDNLDNVSIDHVVINNQGFTTVTSANGVFTFDDAFTNNIHLLSDFGNINILATVKPVTLDGRTLGSITVGKAGNMQGILAPVSLADAAGVTLDDSADPSGQNVTVNVANNLVTVAGLAHFATISFQVNDGTQQGFNDLGFLDILGGHGGNTFNVLDTPEAASIVFPFFIPHHTLTTISAGTGGDTVNVRGTHSELLTLTGTGHSTVHIGNNGSLQGIQGPVDVLWTAGSADLVVDGSADTRSQDVLLSASIASAPNRLVLSGMTPPDGSGLYFNNIEMDPAHISLLDVKGGSGGSSGNTFTLDDTLHNGKTVVEAGAGRDQVIVHGTTGPLDITSQGGADTIRIGHNGSLLGIQGAIHITNPPNWDSVIVDGSSDTFDTTFTLSATPTLGLIQASYMASITYNANDVNHVYINGGRGTDTFFVQSTTRQAPVQIDAGTGISQFVVGNGNNSLDNIRSTLTLVGGFNYSSLTINDQGSTSWHWYDLNPGFFGGQFTRDGGGPGGVTINFDLMNYVHYNPSTAPISFNPDPFFP
jgi:hypothetical protein